MDGCLVDAEFAALPRAGRVDGVEVTGEYLMINGGVSDELCIYSIIGYNEFEKGSFSSDQDFTGGGGFKMTLGEHGKITYGAIGQIMFSNTELPHRGNVATSGNVKSEADFYEIQLAVGSVYECGDMKIYGGPMVHFIDGRLDTTSSTGTKGAFDLEEDIRLWFTNKCESKGISFRAAHKLLRVARTIADLEAEERITQGGLLEAWNLRYQESSPTYQSY